MLKYLQEEESQAGKPLITWASRTSLITHSSVPGLWASRQIEPRRAPQAAAGNIQTKGLNSTMWLLHRFRININLLLLKFLTHWRFWTLKKKKQKNENIIFCKNLLSFWSRWWIIYKEWGAACFQFAVIAEPHCPGVGRKEGRGGLIRRSEQVRRKCSVLQRSPAPTGSLRCFQH